MMRKLTTLWAPNTQLVQGTFSRWRAMLRGTYRGQPIMAYMAKEGDENNTTYGYNLRTTGAPGFENWSALYVAGRKGAPGAWHLRASSHPAERLTAAGLLAALEEAPKGLQFRYRASSGRMQLAFPGAGMYYCPDVQSFQWQLDFLARLAAITQAAAGASAPAAGTSVAQTA